MIKYVFELRKDKVTQDGLMPIRILFRIGSSVIKRNTGLNCKPEDWQNNRLKANTKKENRQKHTSHSKRNSITVFVRSKFIKKEHKTCNMARKHNN